MKKSILLGLPLLLIAPLLLLMLGMGNANIESVRAACATPVDSAGGSMRIGTLNWRGASHYTRNPHPGERPYNERVPNMVAKINSSGTSIIGFQEFEPPQAQAFLKATNGNWAIVKGKDGSGRASTANAIAYQRSAWKLDETRYVSIHYGRPKIQIPLARFTSTTGLGSIWVLNTHNPARAVGGTTAMRNAAVRAEATALAKLQAAEPNTALFLTGDMNDASGFKRLFLSLAPGWSAANPSNKGIDWIMGSPTVTFSSPVVDRSTNDKAHKYTDHPFVHTSVQLAGSTPGQPAGNADAGVGVMPTAINATPGSPVKGQVTVANANIKLRSGATPGIRALARPAPDFITLNEVDDVPLTQMKSAAPGYDAYREKRPAGTKDAGQAMGNAIMWRSDTWTMLDGGRVKIVNNDQVVFKGKNKRWDRFAEWAIFQRADGAVVSVIATHHMTNVYKEPRQWGNPSMSRAEQYGLGMDYLIDLMGVLSEYGPVLVGGDMNSHPKDGANAAAPRMASAGYRFTKDAGVIYNFFAEPVKVTKTWQISKAAVHSDHPALFTRMAMNGAGPATERTPGESQPDGARPAGCQPCPPNTISTALQNVAASGDLDSAKVAAEAASKAGFRGEDLVTAVAIARVESSWNPKAVNGTHYGLWQISAQHKGKVPGWNTQDDIFTPLLNAQYAFALYSARAGSGEAKFADWIPFEKTDYHQYLDGARRAVAAIGGTTTVSTTDCTTGVETSGVSGDRLNRLRQRAEMIIKLAQRYSSPCSVPGFDCQGVGFSGWSNACTAISMMIYGNSYVGPGDGGERAYGSVVQGQQGSSWPPPPGAIVSWPYSGSGHVAIYLGDGDWVDNWGPVGHHAHEQVEKGATAHWLLPPSSFEGKFLDNGIGSSS